MKKNLCTIVISAVLGLLISQSLYSQNFANNWVFGNFGLEFKDNAVTIRHDYIKHQSRGSGIISDKQGKLLFYSDGLNVWNKNHVIMANGNNLLTLMGGTSLQETLIIPKPGSNSLYYLFTVDPQNGDASSGLYYSIVDMNLDKGLGDVTIKGNKLINGTTNVISATFHENREDIWVIVQKYNSNKYYSILITKDGISNNIIETDIGTINGSGFADPQLKFSPDGKKVASGHNSFDKFGFDLFDFDPGKGILSNPLSFDFPSRDGCEGIEFSSDATKLYVLRRGNIPSEQLFQYNLASYNYESINDSRLSVLVPTYTGIEQMQLAPNGKIYFAKGGGDAYGTKYLGVINNPNELGANCKAIENGLFLEGGNSVVERTPNFIQNYFFKTNFTFENTCQAHPVGFNITNTYQLDSVRWSFGEGTSSKSLTPKFQYAEAGNYTVRLLAFYPEKTDTIIKQITINPFSKFDLGKDTTVCFGHELSVAEGFKSYRWNTGATTRSIRIEKEGKYKITVENSFGCFSSDSILLKVIDLPVINMPDSVVIGASASVKLSAGQFNSYLWSTGETTATIDVSKEGWYSVAVTNASGCLSAKSVFVSKGSNTGNQEKTGWILLNPLPSARSAQNICFINSQIGFVVNDKEIIGTTDGGDTWNVKMEISSGKRIAFKNSIGYVIGDGGSIYKSTYFGEGWNKLNTSFTDNLNSISLIHQDTLLVTGVNKLFISNDGGQSWVTRNVTGAKNIEDSYFTSAKVGVVGCSDGTILKTVDGGLNWKVTSSVGYIPANIFRVYFMDKNIGFASRGYDDILKTTDGGETWKVIPNTTDDIYSYYFLDEQNGFIAGEDGVIFKTSNGGATWEWAGFQNGRIDGTSINSLYFFDKTTGFAVGARGRIMKTIDGGQNWKDYSPTYGNVKQLDFVTEQVGYGLVGNTFYKTSDKGKTWTNMGAPVKTGNTTQFDFINENIGYCIAGGDINSSAYVGKVYKTIDGGKTWLATNKGGAILDDNLYSIDFVDESTGYVSGGYNGDSTFKTIDGGNSWQRINDISFGQIQFLTADVGYARNVGNLYNRIYKTTDGGKNWVATFEIDKGITSFYFIDENNGYFVGDNSLAYKTSDGGKTWQKLTIPYGYYVKVRFYSNHVGYITGEYGALYKTTNGGVSWDAVNTPYSVPGIEILEKNICIYGGSGVILKNTIDYQPASLFVGTATNISNSSVTLTGNATSNGGKIENIRFEYGISNLNTVAPGDPNTVNSGASTNTSAVLNNLSQNTTYSYRLKATCDGVEYQSNILQFKTLPDFQLTMNWVNSFSSNEADLTGNIISNSGDITNIEFQYGTDMLSMSRSIEATPDIVPGKTTKDITGKLKSLEPKTKYYVRVKAKYKGAEIYSSTVNFTTHPEFEINLYFPTINGTTASLSATVAAYKDTIKHMIVEYDTIRSYSKIVSTTPDQINKNNSGYIQAQLKDLNINKVYYYRIKAKLGDKTIVSSENIIRIAGGILIIPIEVQPISDSSIKLQGLINASGKSLFSIQFEYGTTKDFGNTISSFPNYSSGMLTNTVQATLTGLKPNTEYYFRIKGTDGTTVFYSDEVKFTTGISTGLDMSEDLHDVIIFPNPASDYLNVKSYDPIEKIEFMDINGRILMSNTNKDLLDISNYAIGFYFVKVYTKKGSAIRKVIIK